MTAYKLNKMASSITKLQSILPNSLHPTAITFVFNHMVKLAGTAGIRIESLTHTHATVSLQNKRRIQNHIGGLHACSMALAAESASKICLLFLLFCFSCLFILIYSKLTHSYRTSLLLMQ